MVDKFETLFNELKTRGKAIPYIIVFNAIVVLLIGMLLMFKGSGGGIGFVIVFFGWFLTIVYYLFVVFYAEFLFTSDSEHDVVMTEESLIHSIINDSAKYRLTKTDVKVLRKVLRKIDDSNSY